MKTAVCAALVLFLSCTLSATASGTAPRTRLRVGLFAYIPRASDAALRIEREFETSHATIDLEVALFDPYYDTQADTAANFYPTESAKSFDLIEIDLARLDAIKKVIDLDPLPGSFAQTANDYVGPAHAVLTNRPELVPLAAPHWVCGNFLFVREGDPLEDAKSYTDVRALLHPAAGRALLTDLSGRAGLGEFYADAVLDLKGKAFAEQHLKELGTAAESDVPNLLVPDAVTAVLGLLDEMPSDLAFGQSLRYLHDVKAERYAELFAQQPRSALLGYSERLFFVEGRLRDEFGKKGTPRARSSDFSIRQFSFGAASQGTPTWVDAFVTPKGALADADKAAAAAEFLTYMRSVAAYDVMEDPTGSAQCAYLLPAATAAYADGAIPNAPLLPELRAALDDSFVVTDGAAFEGIRRSGKVLRSRLDSR